MVSASINIHFQRSVAYAVEHNESKAAYIKRMMYITRQSGRPVLKRALVEWKIGNKSESFKKLLGKYYDLVIKVYVR